MLAVCEPTSLIYLGHRCTLTVGEGTIVGDFIVTIGRERVGNPRMFGLNQTVLDGVKESLKLSAALRRYRKTILDIYMHIYLPALSPHCAIWSSMFLSGPLHC